MISSINFIEEQRKQQIGWRKAHISSSEWGWQNKRQYEYIIPRDLWKEALWDGIRTELPSYLTAHDIKPHTGVHNLMSSWIVAANLYFPIRLHSSLKEMMAEFLRKKLFLAVDEVEQVELEYAMDGEAHPATLLGETDGGRGVGQTSPDVAFICRTNGKTLLVLTECKYTEHSFYSCSARATTGSDKRTANPNPERCLNAAGNYDYKEICHQTIWGRKYWDYLNISSKGQGTLKRCPAASAGYQLFRQHALAEGILQKKKFDFVASTVSFDCRNDALVKSLRSTGISDFQTEWKEIFDGKVIFKTWTHQDWVEFVRKNQKVSQWDKWLNYLNDRYGY